jgi:hypothetical protein
LPLLVRSTEAAEYNRAVPLLLANLNSIPLDYVLRQKVQGQNLNWFIIEQLPVLRLDTYGRKFGKQAALEIVRNDVLALTYTSNDMEPFARDMAYSGAPFKWDEADRARRRARLDALYFMMYFPSATPNDIEGLRDTAAYIFSTFPIVEREDRQAHGRYLSRDLCLAYINALAAGDPDANIAL